MKETVSSILSKDCEERKSFKKLRKINKKLDRLLDAAECESDWEQIYNHIFHEAQLEVEKLLDSLNKSFPEYWDPDTTYEADVRAWVKAFKEVYEEVK